MIKLVQDELGLDQLQLENTWNIELLAEEKYSSIESSKRLLQSNLLDLLLLGFYTFNFFSNKFIQ